MDLEFLRPLYGDIGGYVSVYLDTSPDAEDGGQAIDLRWRSARERLAGAGADEATLAALYFLPGDLVTSIQAPPGGVGATLRYTGRPSSKHGPQRSSGTFLLNTRYSLHGSRLHGKRLGVESTVGVLRGIHVCD